MPAYLRPLHPHKCGWTGCNKDATHQLRNTYNEPINEYCKQHGPIALARLEEPQGEG